MGDNNGESTETRRQRGRRPTAPTDRKDRVIQTRVPRDLESTLRDAADRERVTVSHLIRNVLEDTFHLVDNIVADSATLVNSVSRDAKKIAASARRQRPARAPASSMTDSAPPPDIESVDAWQAVVLNRAVQCAQCHKTLVRGQPAYRGLSSQPGAPTAWLCDECLGKL